MENEWNYFIKDLRIEQEIQEIAENKRIWNELNLKPETIKVLRNNMTWGFRDYRETVEERRQALVRLLKVHTEVCQEMYWDTVLKRRHNALVYSYVVDIVAGSRVVAKKLNISKEMLYIDLKKFIKDMLIFCIGLPYLLEDIKKTMQIVVKLIIKYYPFLKQVEQTEQCLCLFPFHLQNDIQKGRRATKHFIQLFDKSIMLYEDFGQQHGIHFNERRMEILRQNIKGNRNVEEIMKKYGCGQKTVYTDMKENQERLCQLLSVFLG